MSIKTIELNGEEFELKMTFKSLAAFGIVKNKVEENTEKIGNLAMGLMTGDIFSLKEAIANMSGKNSKDVEKQLEQATEEEIETAFENVLDFLETNPLTKQASKMIIPEMKSGMKKLKAEMSAQTTE